MFIYTCKKPSGQWPEMNKTEAERIFTKHNMKKWIDRDNIFFTYFAPSVKKTPNDARWGQYLQVGESDSHKYLWKDLLYAFTDNRKKVSQPPYDHTLMTFMEINRILKPKWGGILSVKDCFRNPKVLDRVQLHSIDLDDFVVAKKNDGVTAIGNIHPSG